MSTLKPASWSYAEAWLPEDDFVIEARAKADELSCTAIGRIPSRG